VVRSIAEQLGVDLDGIETAYELWPAEESFDYQGRRIEQGTIAGFRFEIAGVVGGPTKVAVEHVTRTRDDQAPLWPRGLAGGFNITAMRAVNAIPLLCAADPGVLSTFDLPPVTGRRRVAR
jgi:4-hydroxy-tetrahydrodipicolinate reductase